MRIVFMGTPDFAVPTLTALVEGGHEVIAAVTQPDKPKGRGKSVLMTPVREKAIEYQIPVYQPVKVRDPEFVDLLKVMAPDAIVVVAFGQILPKVILDLPKYGCVNVHASLLPKYRGAAPIQWAVIDGEKESGVTTMMMDVGLDTGDMLEQKVIPLDEKETGGSLFDKLSEVGARLLIRTLEELEDGTAQFEKQPAESTTEYAEMLTKKSGNIDWNKSAAEIECLIRGMNPWPSAYTAWRGKTLKIWAASVYSKKEIDEMAVPGTVVGVTKQALLVQTGDGVLALEELQPEGKKRMPVDAFLRGYPMEAGEMI